MRVLLLKLVTKRGIDSMDVILEDGRCSYIYHNGEHWLTDYYSDSINVQSDDIWEELAEGKIFNKHWPSNYIAITDEMIDDAVEWHNDDEYSSDYIEYTSPEENDQVIIKEWFDEWLSS